MVATLKFNDYLAMGLYNIYMSLRLTLILLIGHLALY